MHLSCEIAEAGFAMCRMVNRAVGGLARCSVNGSGVSAEPEYALTVYGV